MNIEHRFTRTFSRGQELPPMDSVLHRPGRFAVPMGLAPASPPPDRGSSERNPPLPLRDSGKARPGRQSPSKSATSRK